MKAKPIVPRELATQNVDEALEHYLHENADQAALGFIDALKQAYAHIGRQPATGSPRYAQALCALDQDYPQDRVNNSSRASVIICPCSDNEPMHSPS